MAGVPVLGGAISPLIPQELSDLVGRFAFGTGTGCAVPAPPCEKQGKFDFGGERTDYPHVRALPPAP